MRGLLAALAVVAGTAAAGPAAAEGVPRSGAHPPVPEYTVPFGRGLELRARVVEDRTGAPPLALTKPVQLRFQIELRATEAARAEDLALTCRLAVVGTDSRQVPLREGPCFAGPLPPPGRWVPVGEPVRFRPNPHGAPGAGGIVAEVSAGRGRPARLMATYGWTPGG